MSARDCNFFLENFILNVRAFLLHFDIAVIGPQAASASEAVQALITR
jgi:hypothetical protein